MMIIRYIEPKDVNEISSKSGFWFDIFAPNMENWLLVLNDS
jgi:hypothetical protein